MLLENPWVFGGGRGKSGLNGYLEPLLIDYLSEKA